MEINQYDITMVTHYDITMGNDIASDVHCEITMGNDVANDIHCDLIMSNDIAMCTIYHGITMHNEVDMNLFYYVFSALCLIMILLWVDVIKTRTSSYLISLCWRTHSLFQTHEISLHKHNSCVLPRLIKHSLVLVITLYVLLILNTALILTTQ